VDLLGVSSNGFLFEFISFTVFDIGLVSNDSSSPWKLSIRLGVCLFSNVSEVLGREFFFGEFVLVRMVFVFLF